MLKHVETLGLVLVLTLPKLQEGGIEYRLFLQFALLSIDTTRHGERNRRKSNTFKRYSKTLFTAAWYAKRPRSEESWPMNQFKTGEINHQVNPGDYIGKHLCWWARSSCKCAFLVTEFPPRTSAFGVGWGGGANNGTWHLHTHVMLCYRS